MAKIQSGNSFKDVNVNGDMDVTNNGPHIDNRKFLVQGNRTSIFIGIVVVAVIAIVALVFIFGQQKPEKLIIGQWQYEHNEEIYEFTKDGRFLRMTGANDAGITYTVDGDSLYLNVNVLWASSTIKAKITVDSEKLDLTILSDPDSIFGYEDGFVMRFTRVK